MSSSPRLVVLEHSVIMAEGATGIVLNEDGSWHQRGQPSSRKTFPTLEDALSWSREYIRLHPGAECNVYDSSANRVARIVDDDDSQIAPPRRRWWQFWK